ncbi:MAG TPA: hypothetical protein EYH41_11270 [Novosphingobium capsulatum]|nr:hypothetical protein [Novosphingobium capsulatum]
MDADRPVDKVLGARKPPETPESAPAQAPETPETFDLEAFRARQKARNRALGLLLGALVVLFFAITIAKLGVQASHRP